LAARQPGPVGQLWTELARREISRRGDFYQWPFREMDAPLHVCPTVGSLAEEIFALTEALARSEARDVALLQKRDAALAAIERELSQLADLWSGLHAIDGIGPFAGCATCEQPCRYRYTARAASTHAAEIDIDASDPLDGLVQQALDFLMESFHREDLESLDGAALCWIVQSVDASGRSADIQVSVAEVAQERIRSLLAAEEE
jgi:hypothetical protein